MRAWMVFLGMIPACGFQSPASSSDANTDAPPDAPATQFGSIIHVKFSSPSDVPMTPPTLIADVNTDTSTLCDTHNDQAATYCVIVGTRITIASGMTLRAHGTKPLVLLATDTFDLEGSIDVSSKHGDPKSGSGAKSPGPCLGTTAAMGHSGGYGGSFGGMGGPGGTPVSTTDEAGGVPGPGLNGSSPADLRGGCFGGDGAGNPPPDGAGGSGGGAVAIIAVTSIHLNGQINASGAGGLGGTGNSGGGGGGGGGSGGMIVLDAPLIDAGAGPNVWLFANGGGGGQGGTPVGGPGAGPGDGGMESSNPTTQAPGGANTGRSGGNGGNGTAGTSKQDGDPAAAAAYNGDGGGGGGGAGFIRSPAVTGAVFAPAPTSP